MNRRPPKKSLVHEALHTYSHDPADALGYARGARQSGWDRNDFVDTYGSDDELEDAAEDAWDEANSWSHRLWYG